jgi:hypothetical protein
MAPDDHFLWETPSSDLCDLSGWPCEAKHGSLDALLNRFPAHLCFTWTRRGVKVVVPIDCPNQSVPAPIDQLY